MMKIASGKDKITTRKTAMRRTMIRKRMFPGNVFDHSIIEAKKSYKYFAQNLVGLVELGLFRGPWFCAGCCPGLDCCFFCLSSGTATAFASISNVLSKFGLTLIVLCSGFTSSGCWRSPKKTPGSHTPFLFLSFKIRRWYSPGGKSCCEKDASLRG